MMRPKGQRVLPGDVFGRLTVISESVRNGYHRYWNCTCVCGKKVTVYQGSLTRGATTSCGCYQKDAASSANLVDLTGMVFGRLTVVDKAESRKGQTYWNCICSCGKSKAVASTSLVHGKSKSCGCLNKEYASERMQVDLVGKKFGKLTVIRRSTKQSKQGQYYWECLCDCGNASLVAGNHLTSGRRTVSCGCAKDALVGEKHPNWNPNLTNSERQLERNIPGYSYWRSSVYKRDDYTCVKCGQKGKELNAHHVESYDNNDTLRLAMENGSTLCSECHRKFHKKYGRGNNTNAQFLEFLTS